MRAWLNDPTLRYVAKLFLAFMALAAVGIMSSALIGYGLGGLWR
ncbi:MAG: hypothetical protein OXQ29_03740 [Rhodospirillaceae bacterium]|nr:hypothetical protein [Rhodospirillaceae bacterium]